MSDSLPGAAYLGGIFWQEGYLREGAIMAYDEGLAERLRDVLSEQIGVTEKKMFGGLAFL